ncbi:MAG: hypothetical protein KJI71_00585 [Patescibacteria group bacterium]|nr:hypothetical protein [Patescibacteria group bacterium]
MLEYTPSKPMIEFLKVLKSVTPITKEIFDALKQLTTEEIKACVETPPKDIPYSYALNCKNSISNILNQK